MKILLLEDNKFDADLVIRDLKGNFTDITIDHVVSLADANLLIEKNLDYSILLIDINLPDGNGLEFLFNIRLKNQSVPTIILTSVRDEEQVVAALKAGASDYFIKGSENFFKLHETILYHLSRNNGMIKNSLQILQILYLEHHKSDIDLTLRYFRSFAPQFKTEIINSAEQLLEKNELKYGYKANSHILLIDYNLPGINTLELVKTIRQERKLDIPIIILTGQGSEEIAVQSLKLGADDYIVKKDNYLVRLPNAILNAYQHRMLLRQKSALQESETRYRLLAENSGDVIFTLDKDLYYTYISPSVYKLRGYNTEEVVGQHISETLTKESFKQVKKLYLDNFTPDKPLKNRRIDPFVLELAMYKKSKKILWTEVIISILFNDSHEPIGFLGATRDITKRRKADKELLLAKEKAEESNRLKSAFLANMSHEIRTPMNGILGFASLLKDRKLTNLKKVQYIKMIEKSGNRMLDIINDLINISKIEAGQIDLDYSMVNLSQLMNNLFDFFEYEAKTKNIQLNLVSSSSDNGLRIKTDKEKLYAILSNLIKNAIKFTKKGYVEFGYSLEDNKIQFYVKDSGVGIAKDKQTVIFERFTQADNKTSHAYEGVGLGLSISKAYVKLLGGKIWLESQINKGSEFYFYLPYN